MFNADYEQKYLDYITDKWLAFDVKKSMAL